MINPQSTFTAGDVAFITSVSHDTQRNWRRFGFIPDTNPGGKAEFSLIEIARVCLIKAHNERGLPLADSARYANVSAPNLRDMISVALRRKSPLKSHLAVIAFGSDATIKLGDVVDVPDLTRKMKAGGSFHGAGAMFILDLAPIAAQIAKRIQELDDRLGDREKAAKERLEALESRNPGLKG